MFDQPALDGSRVNESDRVKTDDESDAGRDGGSVGASRWLYLVVGLVSGATLTIVFGLTSYEVAGSDTTTTVTTLEAPESTTTSSATSTTSNPDTESNSLGLPEALAGERLLVAAGQWPELALETWDSNHVESAVQLPWFAQGLSTDASGRLFAFHALSEDGLALFVGMDDGYVVLSPWVESWVWHSDQPGVISWIEASDNARTVYTSRIQAEWLGDRNEYLDVQAETSEVDAVAPNERVIAHTNAGLLLGVRNTQDSNASARLLDGNGGEVAAIKGLHPVPSAFTGDGVGLAEVSVQGPIKEYRLIGSGLEPYADIGSHYLLDGQDAAWSPNGEELAVISYIETEDEAEYSLEIWNRDGEQQLDVPMPYRVWNPVWTSDGSHVVMVGTKDSDSSTLVLADAQTGDWVIVRATHSEISNIAAGQ